MRKFRSIIVVVLALLCGAAGSLLAQSDVTSEATHTVGVYRGRGAELKKVTAIPVGKGPHNLALSPDGKWVVVGNRRGDQLSVLETSTLTEKARIKTGRQPHDIVFTADSSFYYVGHEIDRYISEYEVGTWKELRRFNVKTAQHDLAIRTDHSELWFTVAGDKYKEGPCGSALWISGAGS